MILEAVIKCLPRIPCGAFQVDGSMAFHRKPLLLTRCNLGCANHAHACFSIHGYNTKGGFHIDWETLSRSWLTIDTHKHSANSTN